MKALSDNSGAATAPQTVAIPLAVPGRKPTPRASLRAHRLIAAIIFVTLTALGLYLANLYGRAGYRTEAAIRVSPTVPVSMPEDFDQRFTSSADYQTFVQQQVVEIDGPDTAGAALDLLGPRRSLWQRPGETNRHAAERLAWDLDVRWVPGTYLITVGLEGQKPAALAQIVNAVVQAYLTRQQAEAMSGNDASSHLLLDHKADLQRQVDSKRAQLSGFAQTLSVSDLDKGAGTPYDRMLDDSNVALDRARRDLVKAKAHLDAMVADQQRMKSVDLDPAAEQMLANNSTINSAKSELIARREADFLELGGLGPHHPGRPELEREISQIDAEIARTNNSAVGQLGSVLRGNRDTTAREETSRAQAAVDEAQQIEQNLETQDTALRQQVASFSAQYSQALAVREDMESLRKQILDINDRVNMLRLQNHSPDMVQLETAAPIPDTPENGKRRKIFLVFTLAALFLAVAVPVAIDLMNPIIGDPAEIEAILGFPLLGVAFGTASRGGRDAMRRIALGILREHRASGTRSFVLSAVRPHAGTTMITLALARELSDLGVRTAALEANASNSDARYLSVSANSVASDSAVRGINIVRPNRSRLPTGSLRNPYHSIVPATDAQPDRIPICRHDGGPKLKFECIDGLVQLALADHDIVLIDAPAVLNSPDPGMLVQTPAAAILIVREGRDQLCDVTAAARELERLRPPAVGAIASLVPLEDRIGLSREISAGREITMHTSALEIEHSGLRDA